VSYQRPPAASAAATSAGSAAPFSTQLIAAASNFQVLLPSAPNLSLQGGQPARAQALQVDAATVAAAPRRPGTNPSLSSGGRARTIHRAAILQNAAIEQLRRANDARVEENKYSS
jgi:hypothetical protein